jgi:hypothetical protein
MLICRTHAVWTSALDTTAHVAAGAASSTLPRAVILSRTCPTLTTAQTGTQAPTPTACKHTRDIPTIEAPDSITNAKPISGLTARGSTVVSVGYRPLFIFHPSGSRSGLIIRELYSIKMLFSQLHFLYKLVFYKLQRIGKSINLTLFA